MALIRIGISGWRYKGWRGDFYPRELPQRRELEYASRVLNSLEINGTFYSLQSPDSFQQWAEATPADFVFAVKGPRFITHMKRLRDVRAPLANFFANGLLRLGGKLGPILWQLPPRMRFEPDRVAEFCSLLPKNTQEAAALASEHDNKVKGKAWFDVSDRHRLRHAFEPRDESFLCEEFLQMLRREGHALVFAEAAKKFPAAEDITAGFIYVRLHGATELYASRYEDADLRRWATRVRRWSSGGEMKTGRRVSDHDPPERKSRDVYVYFDNDSKGHAPFDAIRLAKMLDVGRDLDHLQGQDGKPLPLPERFVSERS